VFFVSCWIFSQIIPELIASNPILADTYSWSILTPQF
jgi:hypothetical protein